MPMCEIILHQLPHKNAELKICPNRFVTYPFVKEYAHIPYSENYLSHYSIIIPIKYNFNERLQGIQILLLK